MSKPALTKRHPLDYGPGLTEQAKAYGLTPKQLDDLLQGIPEEELDDLLMAHTQEIGFRRHYGMQCLILGCRKRRLLGSQFCGGSREYHSQL